MTEAEEMRTAATNVVKTLQGAGYRAYFAGGSVRDQLLGKASKDIDIATDASPDEVQELFARTTGEQGKCFGVVRVLEGNLAFEVAMFRKDGSYIDGRRPESVEQAAPEEDAQRRDFTINGLFFDPVADHLIDYVEGQRDLKTRTIRAIGEPARRFDEDKLRLLRAVRFASTLTTQAGEAFTIEPATWEALREHAPLIAQVSPERIRGELDKIWSGPRPADGLRLLHDCGLLAQILPEIAALDGVEQPPQFHPEGDVFTHVHLMMQQLSNAPLELALGVLFHDVGKKPTMKIDETGRIRFNGHETVGAEMTETIMRRLRYSNDIIRDVTTLVRYHMQFKDVLNMRESTLKRVMARDTFDHELELHRIDCWCSHRDLENYHFLKNRREEFSQDDIKPPRLVSGHDLISLGMRPGREIGEILEAIETAQLEGKINTANEALDLAKRMASGGQ